MVFNDSKMWRILNPEKQLLVAAKQRAKKFGHDFNITYKDIKIPEVCPYLGIPIVYVVGEGRRHDAPSLDRIDNHKGYIKGNIMVISKKANLMKTDASLEELIIFANNILSLHSK